MNLSNNKSSKLTSENTEYENSNSGVDSDDDLKLSITQASTSPTNNLNSNDLQQDSEFLATQLNLLGRDEFIKLLLSNFLLQSGSVYLNAHDYLIDSLDLTKESERLKTFYSWVPLEFRPEPAVLAKNGFFYEGILDSTQCAFCKCILANWQMPHLVSTFHFKESPNCRNGTIC